MADTGTASVEKQKPEAPEKTSPDNVVLHQSSAGNAFGEPPKKKRKVVKPNPDKKFECKHPGCGKSYSRAEHLYRHQLNHTPKTIYRCDYPECSRHFVRQDLCIRHRERHTTHGSQLSKRDTFAQGNQDTPSQDLQSQHHPARNYPISAPRVNGPGQQGRPTAGSPGRPNGTPGFKQQSTVPNNAVSPSDPSREARYHPATPQAIVPRPDGPLHRSNSTGDKTLSPIQKQEIAPWPLELRRQSFNPRDLSRPDFAYDQAPARDAASGSLNPLSPIRQYSSSSAPAFDQGSSDSLEGLDKSAPNGFVQQAGTGPTYTSTAYQATEVSRTEEASFTVALSHALIHGDPYPYTVMNGGISSVELTSGYGYSSFGIDEYANIPYTVAGDFTHGLFNDNQPGSNNTFSSPNYIPSYSGQEPLQVQAPYFSQSPTSTNGYLPHAAPHPMSVTSILDTTDTGQYIMSESKRQELLHLMQTQFIERPHDAVKKRKDSVFEGDLQNDGHILSLSMMKTYIGSYWYHQHAQLPILHKPTFSADRTPNLLLLAVIAIGAATLDKAYGTSLTDSAAEFANFVAWHVRWEIVRDEDFRPPAKLWVFQTLLLIEVYEKMYATRALHERAHIHHDSTLTLMRRGSSLLGRSAADSPPSLRGEQDNGRLSVPFSGSEASKSEEAWHRWITTEATRRAAFAAFVIDSIHATMFGHAAKMVAHEMRMQLPCDEGLWSAVSAAEASRVQLALQTNGIKPTMFLDGLKRTLNGEPVRTNSFGRTIIMAGLLSVSWHMTQRDLQISSLGARTATSFGGPDKWKGVLLRAFDNWKRDFDEALAEAAPTPSSPLRTPAAPLRGLLRPVDDENIFESRTVLHHLAHIAAHVDVVDCQVFAGANRLLGRSITPKDYSVIREKIQKWALKASARDAAFYALKFIDQVLIPPDDGIDGVNCRLYGHASPILPQAFDQNQYVARDDFLLNRPWVLYISALVVWCYGFALEGPIKPAPKEEDFATYRQKEADMRDYLNHVGGVRAPDDLESVKGKNRCLGLLMILKESFESTRWELTHEAAGLLGNACLKLRGVDSEFFAGPSSDDLELANGLLKGHGHWKGHHNYSGHSRHNSRDHMTVANAARV